jgi:hypothetical protein
MKIIQFAAVFTLLSVSSPLAQASKSIDKDDVNDIITSSSNLLRAPKFIQKGVEKNMISFSHTQFVKKEKVRYYWRVYG